MNKLIRHIADRFSIWLLRFRCFERMVMYLSYQHKRVTRRRIEAHLTEQGVYGDTVMEGPFKGLRYLPPKNWASCRFEKIIGAYEFEIHDLLDRLIRDHQHYTTIVVIGAAEGFYAVGLARVFPNARVLAFEPLEQRSQVLKQMAAINQVSDRISIEGFCDPEKLLSLNLTQNTLIVCDVDGYEQEILDPSVIPWLESADIIAELHDCFVPGISNEIRKRFTSTHHITEYEQTGVPYEKYPVLKNLLFTEIDAMVGSDRKSLQNWFFMEPVTNKESI
jgi:hypothetical protein